MFPLTDTIPSRRLPRVMWGIIALNTLVFLYELTLSPYALNRFFLTWGFVPRRLFLGTAVPHALMTLFTSMFLHGGWLHFIGNMWFLYIFGDNVEDRMGSQRFLIFYLLSGVAAALLQGILSPASRVPLIGASGAISGVLGAYFLFYPYAGVITWVPLGFFLYTIELPAVLYLGLWFLMQFYSGLFSLALPQGAQAGGVAWWAHIGGFLFGLIVARWFVPKRRPPRTVVYPQDYWPW